jgi:carbamoyltransferase
MNILGVNGLYGFSRFAHAFAPGHDPAAALIQNGRLSAFVEEERWIGIKHAKFWPPENSILYCLKTGALTWKDINVVAFGWDPAYGIRTLHHFGLNHSSLRNFKMSLGIARSWIGLRDKIIRGFRRMFPQFKGEFVFVDHHMAHAASAYYCSPFQEAKILTIDGTGELNSGMLGYGIGDKIFRIEDISRFDSLGTLYVRFTTALGFRSGDEGKVMGLASYGDPTKHSFEPFIHWRSDVEYRVKDVFGLGAVIPRVFDGENLHWNKDIAASLQAATERAMNVILNRLENKLSKIGFSSNNLCLAGGVAYNCVANAKLLRKSVTDIFVQPAAGDSGVALGAALAVYGKHIDFDHAYWGPEFTNDEIHEILKETRWKYRTVEIPEVAQRLAKGEIVGWFQGRLEVGPRALGNRSILANPLNHNGVDMKDYINKWVKHREEFRPFCPSMVASARDEYLRDSIESPYMILAFPVRESKKEEIPAVTHVDGTARPQTVTKSQNPKFYALLEEFGTVTGTPILLNTSLNLKGQPNIRDPRTALAFFGSSGMDSIVVGDYILCKKEQ